MTTGSYLGACMTISLKTQYHIGSGYGLGRIIDSLLRVDPDGVPIIPGTVVSGLAAQAMYDLLAFECFVEKQTECCGFHKYSDQAAGLPCKIFKPEGAPSCLMCYFFGSSAEQGVIQWVDFRCISDKKLLRPMMKSRRYSGKERRQYIRAYYSHKQHKRTRTVMEKHFFNQEEGASNLDFKGKILFSHPVSHDRARYLAAALKNIRSVGRRKSRGKGVCRVNGQFTGLEKVTTSLTDLIRQL